MRRRLGPRFGAEAGLIALAAVLAALLELDWPGIVVTVFGMWLAIAIFEIVWARTRPEGAAARAAQAPPVAAAPPPPPVLTRPEMVLPPPPPPAVEAPPPPQPAPAATSPPPSEPQPAAAQPPPAVSGAPRSWNLWELERAARNLAGTDVAADEARQYTLLYLRDFASADGKLPIDFDPLVREVFGEQPPVEVAS